MRVGLAFVVSAIVSFVALTWVQPWSAPDLSDMRAAWTPEPLRPPPLDLPESTCSKAWVKVDDLPPTWSHIAAEEFLLERVGEASGVDLVEVDCTESPCIAWLLWSEGRADPDRVYRWWSLEDAPDAVLWTRSYTFASSTMPGATLQAIMIAPWPGDYAEAGLQRVENRVHDTLPMIEHALDRSIR